MTRSVKLRIRAITLAFAVLGAVGAGVVVASAETSQDRETTSVAMCFFRCF